MENIKGLILALEHKIKCTLSYLHSDNWGPSSFSSEGIAQA